MGAWVVTQEYWEGPDVVEEAIRLEYEWVAVVRQGHKLRIGSQH